MARLSCGIGIASRSFAMSKYGDGNRAYDEVDVLRDYDFSFFGMMTWSERSGIPTVFLGWSLDTEYRSLGMVLQLYSLSNKYNDN